MRMLVFAAVLVLGCSSINQPTGRRLTTLGQASQEISEHERQCIDATLNRTNDQIAAVSDLDADTGLLTQMMANDKDRELAECKANADREEEQLSARQRVEYGRQAKDERERNALMMILTTSLTH
jgi:hypothetical protein